MFMKVACHAGVMRESCLFSHHGCSACRPTYIRRTVIIIIDAKVSVPAPSVTLLITLKGML